MSKINKIRLIDLKEKVIDCVDGLEKTLITMDKYKNEDQLVVEMCNGNFRNLFNGFQSLVEDYTSITLKTIGISVSYKHFKDCLNLCINEGFLTEEFVRLFIPSVRLRNRIAHGYKQPNTEILIDYYKNNKEMYEIFIKSILDTLSRCEDNSNFTG